MAGKSGVLKIDLGNFEQEDREQLISFLRAAIAESKQVGWQQFREQFADTPKRRKRSIRAHLLLAVIFGVHVVAFGTIWVIGGGIQFLVYSAVNGVMAAYLLRSIRHKKSELDTNDGEPSDAPKSPVGSEFQS